MQLPDKPERTLPKWAKTVLIGHRTVRSPADALNVLRFCWPHLRGRHVRSAMAACEAAMTGQLNAEFARDAFIRAKIEADMLEFSKSTGHANSDGFKKTPHASRHT